MFSVRTKATINALASSTEDEIRCLISDIILKYNIEALKQFNWETVLEELKK